jgi:hypothetical protein
MYNPDKLFLRKVFNHKHNAYVPAYKTRTIKNVFNQKLVLYGNQAFYSTYANPIYTYSEPRKLSHKRSDGEKRNTNISRARNQLYILAKCNETHYPTKPIFLTLTFDPKNFSPDFLTKKSNVFPLVQHTFRKLKRHNYNPKYIGITERHKNGNIHFHLLVFNLPFLSIQQWKKYHPHGFIDIQLLDKIQNISAYFVKYMTKDFLSDSELNEKLFFTSRGLQRPSTLYNNDDIRYYIDMAKDVTLVKEITTLCQQTIKHYNLNL